MCTITANLVLYFINPGWWGVDLLFFFSTALRAVQHFGITSKILKIIWYIILVVLTLRSWHRNVLAISLVSFLESTTAVSTLLCAKTKPSLCRLLPGPHRGSLAFMLAEGVGSKQYQLKTTAWGMECWFWIIFDLMKDCYELWTSPSKFAGLRRLAWQLSWQPWESWSHQAWSRY